MARKGRGGPGGPAAWRWPGAGGIGWLGRTVHKAVRPDGQPFSEREQAAIQALARQVAALAEPGLAAITQRLEALIARLEAGRDSEPPAGRDDAPVGEGARRAGEEPR